MSGFVDRENEIFDVLRRFRAEALDFVVVGGYGVSAYQHRFSVDADLVVQPDDVPTFGRILEARGFEKDTDREVGVYGGRYLAYVKNTELPVTIDLLVGALQCRQTDASWSYRYIREHAVTREIEGSEESVQVRVPTEDLLIAFKLHSGRLTDTRDVIALMEHADLDDVATHIDRGDRAALGRVLSKVDQMVSAPNFEDSFKGVFSRGSLPEHEIAQLRDFLDERTEDAD